MRQILNLRAGGGSFKLYIMHPIDRKNKRYSIVILAIALIIASVCIARNPYYSIAIGIFAIYSVTLQIEIMPKVILVALLTVFTFPAIYFTEYLLANQGILPINDPLRQFSQSAMLTAFVLIAPLFAFSIYFIQLVKTAENEKDHYDVIEKHPYVICTEHFTRTKKYTSFTYKGVKCRVGKKCLAHNHIKPAVHLIGLIGMIENGKSVDNDYYVTLWDHRYRKIRYGDYDIIEIHESNEVKDYDFIIAKIITFFDNEINRYKPINRVEVRIVGNPVLSENTIRLLEKHFMKVEYYVYEQEEVSM
jgi:hypothetical protein